MKALTRRFNWTRADSGGRRLAARWAAITPMFFNFASSASWSVDLTLVAWNHLGEADLPKNIQYPTRYEK